ncbi:aminotransferase class I/II-fold pyridoxal phosphate-dependent enzyme [Gammaproteobacteria bacterium]|jgi:alanine-synthesizing transaminase|nr:aminotransferase class I/II-fold pyridoxal phosphate-dependent enzyme [Gammaproteobacteria bacterium]MDA8541839.1 aminotransferase class I/II-fold pyridoxal phosphate-dependent enzyme [Gammaproteobacteria bacterium]MDA8733558.1 aminotransferase class I/II-fold pyridoxal phosphate-dependent enzyme [Gammaproteobacteria bacterium]MDA9570757.1 aminotransferase class I/II-fold pyridoxal phosphate-dependent enzyme [Gammaproteobacteria bacterium]MDA9759471.1 aminotransferase class I/II-fold pyridox|tara:strand:- start:3218 stop:4405 length:1188 start_codon:yes stop_codon:yes gene_type:complete
MPDQDFTNAKKLPPYIFAQINSLKYEARIRGEDIIDFGMGNPDQATPSPIVDKLIETVKNPSTHRYSQSAGLPKLRQAIKDWYSRKYNVELDQEKEIVTCMGSKEGIAHLSLATLSIDDTVLVQSPTYPIHSYGVVIAGANLQSVTLKDDADEFLSDIEESILNASKKPKMIIINFPSNPTTQSVTIDFFKKIVEIGKKYDIWIIHDLAYADIAFDGYKAPSILEVEGAKDIAVEFFTLSKSYNMPGWRVGFCCGNSELVQALTKIKSYLDYGTFTPIQVAAIKAINDCDNEVALISSMYESRRNELCDGLNRIGWDVKKPLATMFVWAKIPEKYLKLGSLEFSKLLIEHAQVAVSPGAGFGMDGDEYVRFSLIENEHRTRQAIRGIKNFLSMEI